MYIFQLSGVNRPAQNSLNGYRSELLKELINIKNVLLRFISIEKMHHNKMRKANTCYEHKEDRPNNRQI